MTRRQFIATLGATVAWPLAALAQQPKLPTIGFLGASTASDWSDWSAAFVERLRELGWIEGRTVAIDYRWAEGRSERYAEIAAEFVQLKVDVIITTGGTPAALAAKQATTVIPIVFAAVIDPVGAGLVASLARPGGNVTGLSIQSSELAGKRLEIMREVFPRLRRLAILANVGNPGSALELDEVQSAARTLGLDVSRWEIRTATDIPAAFDAFGASADALYVAVDPLVNASRLHINKLALGTRLPTMHGLRGYVAPRR